MIESLRIENVAVLERAELELGEGLNVLTGETGAGKSIVLGALAMLAGGRASSDAIRTGAEAATVEAVLRTGGMPELEGELAERGLAAEAGELIVQRTLARSGRSRARVSGQLVPVGVLAELLRGRIEISSQHDSQALLRPEVHGWLLDRMGGLLEAREAVAAGFAAVRRLDEERVRLRAQARERERRRDFLAFQVAEIDEAGLDPAEVADLEARRSRLAHAERLREEGGRALALLVGDPLGDDAASAADRLGEAARRVAALERLDPGLEGTGARLAALGSETREAALDLERHLDGVESDPAALDAVQQRLQRIEQLRRKYGESVEQVLSFRDDAAAELAGIEQADSRADELDRQRGRAAERLVADAETLSRGRRRAAKRLGRAVEGLLRELGMPDARFEVALAPAEPPEGLPCGPSGCEAPEFRFTANAGEVLRPLRKVASGGELSRAFLAVQGALRGSATGRVLVFDEVDAGVGGSAADRVGRALAELAAHHQVLCITHLPQIAAFAHRHFRVEKQTRRRRALASLRVVDGAERIQELARMAGGEAVGEATLRHARDLLASRSPRA